MRAYRPTLLGFLALSKGELMPWIRALPKLVTTNDSVYTPCANANWPPSGVGTGLVPQLPDAELQAALAEVDPSRIKATITKLVSFGTRHTLSSQTDPDRGIGAARDWIATEMRTIAAQSGGRMTVAVQGYTQPAVRDRILFPVLISNVVATLKGETDPERVYVVSGHYDSRNSGDMDYKGDSPGANDDASGVAVSMELARVLSKRRPAATLVFAAVAGEEQGLYGSRYMASTYRNASANVQGMLNNDIVGSSTGSRGESDPYTVRVFCDGVIGTQTSSRLPQGGENDTPAREMGRFISEVAANKYTEMNISMIYRRDRFHRSGDHASFLDQGYAAAVRFTEPNENFAHQHQDVRTEGTVQYGDLPEFVDFDFVARVAKVNMATLWSLGNSPGTVANASIAPILSNDSQLSWTAVSSAGLKGYEVVWRPSTAPQWTHSLYVGNLTTITLPLSKDNVIFGVRTVGTNGYKGPATTPFI